MQESGPFEDSLSRLEVTLEKALPKMEGDWVGKRSGYESEFAALIGAYPVDRTHWDLTIDGLRIEVKKGQSGGWMDLTRYCDMILDVKDWPEIVTLFLHYRKDLFFIKSIVAVTMQTLIDELKLTEEAANAVRKARDLLDPKTRSRLNFQSRLTLKELRKLAFFTLPLSKERER